MAKQKVVIVVFRHAEWKSGLIFGLSLLLHGLSDTFLSKLIMVFLFLGKTGQSDFPEYPPLSGLTYLSELSNYEDSNWEELTVLVTCNKIIFDCFSKKNLYNNFFEEEEFQKLKDQANETCAFLGNQSR